MKRFCLLLLMLAAIIGLPSVVHAQTVLTAPQVLVCPVPLWPPAICPKPAVFSAMTNTINAAGSVSKMAPVWQHTFSGYLGDAPAALIIACPARATISADNMKCTNATGTDASALVAASAVSRFSIGGPAPPTVSTVPVSWTPPTKNADGTALTDLKSYNVYQGMSATALSKVGSIPVGTLAYTTPKLTPGTYYFAITAVNSAGIESVQSATISTVLTLAIAVTVTVTVGP